MHKSPTKSFNSPKKPKSPIQELIKSERFIQTRHSSSISLFPDLQDMSSFFLSPYTSIHSSLKAQKGPNPSRLTSGNLQLQSYKVLDAPGLSPNPSHSTLDWSQAGHVSIGLNSEVYIYDLARGRILGQVSSKFCVTSCKYNETASLLAVGNEKGQLSVFDLEKEEEMIKVDEHKGSLNGCVWSNNVVSSAGNDGVVVHTDLRSPGLVSKFKAHNDEILKIDLSGELIATASRDNTVKVWQGFSKFNFNSLSHFSSLVSLAWNPGERFKIITVDNDKEKKIKLWNVNEGKCEKFSHCNEEITCIDVNEREKCFATGFDNGEVALWNLKEMDVVKKSTGHVMATRKIGFLYDGEQVVTGGDDETVRFWQVFNLKKKDDDGFQVEFR